MPIRFETILCGFKTTQTTISVCFENHSRDFETKASSLCAFKTTWNHFKTTDASIEKVFW